MRMKKITKEQIFAFSDRAHDKSYNEECDNAIRGLRKLAVILLKQKELLVKKLNTAASLAGKEGK